MGKGEMRNGERRDEIEDCRKQTRDIPDSRRANGVRRILAPIHICGSTTYKLYLVMSM